MLTGNMKWGALRSAGAFVLPSHQENFGIAVIEALAMGTPVLISKKVNISRSSGMEQALLDQTQRMACWLFSKIGWHLMLEPK